RPGRASVCASCVERSSDLGTDYDGATRSRVEERIAEETAGDTQTCQARSGGPDSVHAPAAAPRRIPAPACISMADGKHMPPNRHGAKDHCREVEPGVA